MPINLELKIKVPSHKKLESLLNNNFASHQGILKQKDIYYKAKNGLVKLRIENGKYTMIKYLRDETGKRWSNYELMELYAENPEKYLSDILEIIVVVEKRRKLYLYKNTRIHLDEVKNLGKFLELETLVKEGRQKATEEFNEVKYFLRLDKYDEIRMSYKHLIESK